MTQPVHQKTSNRTTRALLQMALLQSADKQKLQQQILELFGVMLSAEELNRANSFYHLLQLVNTKQK